MRMPPKLPNRRASYAGVKTSMQCWGRTRLFDRCKHFGVQRHWPFCQQHRFQPLKWLIGLVMFLAALVGLLQYYTADDGEILRQLVALRDEVHKTQSDQYSELEKRYPLGYCALGIHGDKLISLPPASNNLIAGDWSGLRILKRGTNRAVILLPWLKDLRRGNVFNNVTIDMPLSPGKRQGIITVAGSFSMSAECTRASPVGYVCVLGFTDSPARKK